MRLPPAALLLALAGCSSPAPPPDARAARAAFVDALTARLTQAGYRVDRGSLGVFRVSDCGQLAKCYSANPTSPYVVYRVPLAPGEYAGPSRGSPLPPWRMRADEAVVFVGRTPPRARYFSLRSYLYERGATTLFASPGDALNQLVIGTAAANGDAFDAETVVVTTGDRAVDADVRRFAAAAGAPASSVNTDALPPGLVRFGLGADADSLLMLFRVAEIGDRAAGDAWLADVPGVLLRVRPAVERAPDPFPTATPRTRGTGADESAREAALDRVGDALRAAHPGLTATQVGTHVGATDGLECIAHGEPCEGEVRDAAYTSSEDALLGDAPDDFYVVYGVNHHASGKATYASVTAYNSRRNASGRSVLDGELVGSARPWLAADDPARDVLYAQTFARSCAGVEHCTEVPHEFPGVAVDEPFFFLERAYLEAATRTGPRPAELAPLRVLHFRAP